MKTTNSRRLVMTLGGILIATVAAGCYGGGGSGYYSGQPSGYNSSYSSYGGSNSGYGYGSSSTARQQQHPVSLDYYYY